MEGILPVRSSDSLDLTMQSSPDPHLASFVVIGTRLSGHFTVSSIVSAYAGMGLRRRSSIMLRIFWNKLLGTATSANWKVT